MLMFYKTDSFQIFFGKRRRKFYTAVFISVERFINRKPGTFDQTFALVLLPAGNFFLECSRKIFDLLRRAIFLDELRYRGSKKQGLAAGLYAFFLPSQFWRLP